MGGNSVMEVFKLQTPIMNRIKLFYDKAVTDNKIPAGQNVEFLDYQPDEGFIHSDIDGAVCVYASNINFSEGSGSGTEQQQGDDFITIDLYGFGDPVPDENDKPTPTSREAQKRAEVLVTLAYAAMVDRRNKAGSESEGIDANFGSTVDIGNNQYPVSLEKFDPVGTMTCKRGLHVYRLKFKFYLEEQAVTEILGTLYAGSDDLTVDTFNPGDEPEI